MRYFVVFRGMYIYVHVNYDHCLFLNYCGPCITLNHSISDYKNNKIESRWMKTLTDYTLSADLQTGIKRLHPGHEECSV